ncbi:nucleolin [Lucilia cuprina]|uniref:nucleolin n=1 Tax=Lucilia cuprina TaxID=7375 RepID=UPI001F0672E3|nr:nucleolin [Lucilia cuprina]
MDSSSDSDYCVEDFVKPDKIRKPVNDDSADLLGNFDDVKRQEIMDGTYEDKDKSDEEETTEDESDSEQDNEDVQQGDEEMKDSTETDKVEEADTTPVGKNGLSKAQLEQLRKGASKTNRYVLYVTNLSFDTQKGDLEDLFSTKGSVRSVRIPKQRRGGFAFVEMNDLESYQRGFELHNTELQGRFIKVQFSEAGKKKSANKKNIMKQKNRKLAEMRNEHKTFTKSGKFYDKNIKKEIAHVVEASKRWRKKPGPGGGAPRRK